MTRPLEIAGQKFGRLTALAFERRNSRSTWWRWTCECGRETVARVDKVRAGRIKSCGCLHAEANRLNGLKSRTHGMGKTREYRAWANMMHRCYDPKFRHWEYWGGRGITVCKSWHSFEKFYADMGTVPGWGSLDRINNDGNYEPGNCRWATASEQRRNTRFPARNVGPRWGGWRKPKIKWVSGPYRNFLETSTSD